MLISSASMPMKCIDQMPSPIVTPAAVVQTRLRQSAELTERCARSSAT
jgi:hypothetical protein